MRLEDAGWAPHNDGLHSASVSGAGATFHFIGAQRGRVRVDRSPRMAKRVQRRHGETFVSRVERFDTGSGLP